MDNKDQAIYKDNDGVATVPLAYHETCMTREKREKKYAVIGLIIGWAVSLIAAVGIFSYMWLQYDYTTDIDAKGVYVLTDSQGNVIATDLTPEDVIQLMEGMTDGENPNSEVQD